MGRMIARVFAVVCVGGGVGLLTWGISSAIMSDPIPEQAYLVGLFPSASAVMGWGAGILAVGLTTLVLTFREQPPYGPWEE